MKVNMRSRVGNATVLALLTTIVAIEQAVAAQQLRTYELITQESYAYSADCFVCISELGTQARVAGTFTVHVDLQAGTGALDATNIKLVDFETLTKTGENSTEWIEGPDRPFIGASPIYDAFRTPWSGQLSNLNDALRLTSALGENTTPNSFNGPALFTLDMTADAALLNINLPIIDLAPRIVNAEARLISIVPEPNALAVLFILLAVFGSVFRVVRNLPRFNV